MLRTVSIIEEIEYCLCRFTTILLILRYNSLFLMRLLPIALVLYTYTFVLYLYAKVLYCVHVYRLGTTKYFIYKLCNICMRVGILYTYYIM